MKVRGLAAVAILVLASGLAAASPAAARDAGCPDEPITLRDLIALYRDHGPLATRFPPAVAWINERGLACFGGNTIRFRAFVDGTGGLGGTSTYSVRPRWFLGSGLLVFPTDREVERGVGAGPFYGIAVPPGFGDLQRRYHRQWVIVSAHFADFRAGTCRADGVAGETPSRRQAIRICRSMLVLSSIDPSPRSVASDTATMAAGRALTNGSQGEAANGRWAALATAAALGLWLGWRNRSRRTTRHAVAPDHARTRSAHRH